MEYRHNRRAFPRWPVSFQLRYGQGKERTAGVGCEIGQAGLSFMTAEPPPEQIEIDLEYRLRPTDEGWVVVKGVVRHVERERVGVEFLTLRLIDRVNIVHFIAGVAGKSAATTAQ